MGKHNRRNTAAPIVPLNLPLVDYTNLGLPNPGDKELRNHVIGSDGVEYMVVRDADKEPEDVRTYVSAETFDRMSQEQKDRMFSEVTDDTTAADEEAAAKEKEAQAARVTAAAQAAAATSGENLAGDPASPKVDDHGRVMTESQATAQEPTIHSDSVDHEALELPDPKKSVLGVQVIGNDGRGYMLVNSDDGESRLWRSEVADVDASKAAPGNFQPVG